MSGNRCDFLVIGGGVVGVAISLALAERFPQSSILVLDKEKTAGLHASGRNSGVLHAGFYYTADSLKARFTRDGNREMTALCQADQLALNACGKLVVARNEDEDKVLDTLWERGKANGVPLEMVAADEAATIDPAAVTWRRALYSPTTAVVDPREVMFALVRRAVAKKVAFAYGSRYLSSRGNRILTSTGEIDAGYVVNAAGLYADRIAHDFGFGEDYYLLPFKGVYLYAPAGKQLLRTNIYPVPDLRNPFLGVHFTLTAQGRVKIGPTAIPAFWPEQYGGLAGFDFGEFVQTTARQLGLILAGDARFRRLAVEEIKKYSRPRLVSQAAGLARGIRVEDFVEWGRPGIRAQLYNHRKRALEMDFVVEGDEKSMHVLNAVSPAFTCALPFSRYVVGRIGDTLSSM